MAKTQGDRARPKEYKAGLMQLLPVPSVAMRIVLTTMSAISTCVWLWGVASALTLLVSHMLTSGITSRIVLQRI